jgi:leader peptidase (prepilin peptidase)/N-methyltransferase
VEPSNAGSSPAGALLVACLLVDVTLVVLSVVAGLVLGEELEPVVAQVPELKRLRLPLWGCASCGASRRAGGIWGLVPIAGALRVRRACPSCGVTPEHPWRPLGLASVSAVVFAALGLRLGPHLDLVAYDALALGLVAISAIDLEKLIVPVRVLYPTLLVTAALLTASSVLDGRLGPLWRAVVVGAASSAVFLCIHLVQPRGMGFGDVRLAGLVGFGSAWLGDGWHAVSRAGVAFLAAFVLGALIGLVVMAASGTGRKTRIPFAPFLASGAIVSVLWGAPIAHAWLGRFG